MLITNKLEKEIILYKNQFEEFVLNIFNEYKLERLSMDIDSLLFKIKYMIKFKKDLYKIPILKKEFTDKALELRSIFGIIMYNFLVEIVKFDNKFSENDIIDIFAQDIIIDSSNIKFKMIIVSNNIEYLKFIDNSIKDGIVYNMFPNKFFRYYVDSYNDGVAKAYPELFQNRKQNVIGTGNDADIFCHSFTFQTSENCSLDCTYCYQFNKSNMRMDFGIAKKFIDNLLNDKYGYINRYNSPAIILEFIGGEPLLEIQLTRKIYEYFLEKTYELNHPWFSLHRVSICSNGLQYFDEDVQNFFKDYSSNISFNISIDGNKKLHDSCRVQPNGEGSYDIAMAALNHYNKHYTCEKNSKMTLAPNNMKYLFDSVVDFIKNGMQVINLNCVFEEGWTKETALLEYNELKKLADYILENNLENLYIAIFNERPEDINPKENDGNYCGGLGSMLSLRPNGQFYPCIRYMPTSVGDDVKDLCIGDIDKGIIGREQNSEILNMMDKITRRSQSNDICFNCPIGNDCPHCSALGHTVFGTPEKRTTFICIQMIAEALANVYYWNNLILKHPEYNLDVRRNNVPDDWSLLVIDKDELDNLKLLECAAIAITLENRSKDK